jgi:Domain of unknown function (DUF5597)/Beta-galactosidase
MKIFLLALLNISLCFHSLSQTVKIPHLEKNNGCTRLFVLGKPFLILGGELHNSSTSGPVYMRHVWEQMKKKNLNTVLAPVYWELLEPEKGKFDFSLVDSVILGARKQQLHIILLWFASWKNGFSTYAPSWIKNDQDKYPRSRDKNGKTLQSLSPSGIETGEADASAFSALMRHVKAMDEKYQTVIMIQVENEVGLFNTPRDYSSAANSAFQSEVPRELMYYLLQHKNSLQPELDSVWKKNGYRIKGSWLDIFGKSIFDSSNWNKLSFFTEELFTVYQYSKYIGKVAAAGKREYKLPMFVNTWIKQPDYGWPGKYPSGGPAPHTLDIWHAEAPAIDLIVPDIYVADARWVMAEYQNRNPILIPEIRPGIRSANEALWAFGDLDIIGFSPFGIDESSAIDDPITQTYGVLQSIKKIILSGHGGETRKGILIDVNHPTQDFELGGYRIKALVDSVSLMYASGLKDQERNSEMAWGGMLIQLGKDEFLAVGNNFSLSFTPLKPDGQSLDVDYMEEGNYENGKWIRNRRLNGDEGTGGGDYGFGDPFDGSSAILKFQPKKQGFSIVKFKIYRYK